MDKTTLKKIMPFATDANKSRMKVVHFVMSVKLLPEKHTKADKIWET